MALKPWLVGAAIVVDDGLAKMEAVAQRCARDAHEAGVDRLRAVDNGASGVAGLKLGAEFIGKDGEDVLRLVTVSAKNVVLRLLQNVENGTSGPGTETKGKRIGVAELVEANEFGIDPVVDGNVDRPGAVREGCGANRDRRQRKPGASLAQAGVTAEGRAAGQGERVWDRERLQGRERIAPADRTQG